MKISKAYRTYRTVAYTYQIPGNDQRSTGGVHLHQIRLNSQGQYIHRIVQSNGTYRDEGQPHPATKDQIEAALSAE